MDIAKGCIALKNSSKERKIIDKVIQSGYFLPTLFKDSSKYYKECLKFQSTIDISKRDKMPMHPILEFMWNLLMQSFLPSTGNEYMAVNYISNGSRQFQPRQMIIER